MPENKIYPSQYISLSLLSGAVIAFQIILMNHFSLVQWHHFATMVISIALLGFGASGTFLFVMKKRLMQKAHWFISLSMFLCAIFIASGIPITQLDLIRFDAYLLFTAPVHVIKFFMTVFILFIPFFFAGLAIGMIFTLHVKNIGHLYAFNLGGSGLGGIVVLFLFYHLTPSQSALMTAIFPFCAGIIFIRDLYNKKFVGAMIISGLLLFLLLFIPFKPNISQFKSISRILQMPDTYCIYEKPSPYGTLQIVQSPFIRYAPGISLRYDKELPVFPILFTNGEWTGPLSTSTDINLFTWSSLDLPYRIRDAETILIPDGGTGEFVVHALSVNPQKITVTEANKSIIKAMDDFFQGRSIYNHPQVDLKNPDSYTYLLSTKQTFDLIQLPIPGSFGGSAGIYALKERFTLTEEAFIIMWDLLNADGIMTISTWMDYPPRYPLRIVATLKEVLDSQGIMNHYNHLAAIKTWNLMTFMLTKSPMTEEEVIIIRKFCRDMNFDPVILPGMNSEERHVYHEHQDDNLLDYIDSILSDESERFYADYNFNIKPATENKPYFSQFIRLRKIPELRIYFSDHSLPFLELGYIVLFLTLILVSSLAVLFIIFPLIFRKIGGTRKMWTFFHFSGLGLGFMFVEIVMIQRFTFYLGNPLYAASAVICGILIFSGIGSYKSTRFQADKKNIIRAAMNVLVFIIIYGVFLTPLLKSTINFPIPVKILFSLMFLAPLSYHLGKPFPLGLRFLDRYNSQIIPWAWGINGCMSVISSVLAAILAVETGFTGVMIIAGMMYMVVILNSEF